MKNYFKHIRPKLGRMLLLAILLAIVLTLASTLLRCEYRTFVNDAFVGPYTDGEIAKYNLSDRIDTRKLYCGWPSLIIYFPAQISQYFFANLFMAVGVAVYLIPDLLFWGLVSMILILLYYAVKFKLKSK